MEEKLVIFNDILKDSYLFSHFRSLRSEHQRMVGILEHIEKKHKELYCNMLATLPQSLYIGTKALEKCAPETAENQEPELNQIGSFNLVSPIDVSVLLKNIDQLLIGTIDQVVSTITHEYNILYENRRQNTTHQTIEFFNDVTVKMHVFRLLYSIGMKPTVSQQSFIRSLLEKRNIVVCINGSYFRSIIFALPLLHNFIPQLYQCQVLVIVPTKEIDVYVRKIINMLAQFIGVNIQLVTSGDNNTSVVPQVEVGLPSELFKKITEGTIKYDYIKNIIIIGPEKMQSQTKLIYHGILKSIKRDKHISLFMSLENDIISLSCCNRILGNFAYCFLGYSELQNVFEKYPKQYYFSTSEEFKINLLSEINKWYGRGKFIVHCNSLSKTKELCVLLYYLKASVIHLGMTNARRNQILKLFSSNHIRMLFTSDSIKVKEFQLADCIIYYDFPSNPISYLNEITQYTARTKVVNFINQNNMNTKSFIEAVYKFCMTPWL